MRTFAIEIAEMLDSLAQLVEQLTLNQWVEGSNPSGVTKDGLKKTILFILSTNQRYHSPPPKI